MVVFPADHHILNPSALHDAVRVASETAETSRSLVFFGLAPHSADTRHGYILHGPNPLGLSDPTVYEIERFHEKPLVGTAERYIRQGNCLWNAGTFAWRADTILRELAMYAPNVLKAVRSAMRVADDTVAFGSAYSKVPKVSVDSALLEHSDKRLVVASNIKRIDFESWASLAQVWPQDANGNACAGDIVSVNCNNTVQFSSGKLLATAGLEDCIVIATEDVLLVCHKDRAADVDQLLRLLEARDKH
jgi:mannose-1-phosphate guanylyltransferase